MMVSKAREMSEFVKAIGSYRNYSQPFMNICQEYKSILLFME